MSGGEEGDGVKKIGIPAGNLVLSKDGKKLTVQRKRYDVSTELNRKANPKQKYTAVKKAGVQDYRP